MLRPPSFQRKKHSPTINQHSEVLRLSQLQVQEQKLDLRNRGLEGGLVFCKRLDIVDVFSTAAGVELFEV